MEEIEQLKSQGNKSFGAGDYAQACVFYGRCLEAMIAYDGNREGGGGVQVVRQKEENEVEFYKLKIVIFLNLGFANLKLKAFAGSYRCLNAAIVFCNNPSMPLEDLGVEDDLTEDVTLLLESAIEGPSLQPHTVPMTELKPLATKALFRRGQCKALMAKNPGDSSNSGGASDPQSVARDYEYALRLAPDDKAIHAALKELQSQQLPKSPQSKQQPTRSAAEPASKRKSSNDDACVDPAQFAAMTLNGGRCGPNNIAYWSQTVKETTVHIPMDRILAHQSSDHNAQRTKWLVQFDFQHVKITSNTVAPPAVMELNLKYRVDPQNCVWMLEHGSEKSSSSGTPLYLILHLSKDQNSIQEWTPGCEWWDQVCVDDLESIDTLSCSVGSDVASLPVEAQQRARKEHFRFVNDLNHRQQQQELNSLSEAKKV
jgi:hypothetical protein